MAEIEEKQEEKRGEEEIKQKIAHRKKIELFTEISEKDKKIEELEKQSSEYLKKIEELEKQSSEYLDLAKRLKADFENYKKKEQAEKEQLKGMYQREILLEFLPIFDNFERALKEEKTEKLKDGILLIKKEFENLLLKRNLARIETIGASFSPKFHTAILSIPTKDKESGIILEEVQSGWHCNGACVKPALVVVSKEWEEDLQEGE